KEDEPIFIGKEIARHKDYSENTAEAIDAEVRRILKESLQEATDILTEHRDQLEMLTDALVERETLTDIDVRELLGFPAPTYNYSSNGDGKAEHDEQSQTEEHAPVTKPDNTEEGKNPESDTSESPEQGDHP
ncbi:MAG: cell division protein FtsH, partial [Spirochaetaceae bacterium]